MNIPKLLKDIDVFSKLAQDQDADWKVSSYISETVMPAAFNKWSAGATECVTKYFNNPYMITVSFQANVKINKTAQPIQKQNVISKISVYDAAVFANKDGNWQEIQIPPEVRQAMDRMNKWGKYFSVWESMDQNIQDRINKYIKGPYSIDSAQLRINIKPSEQIAQS